MNIYTAAAPILPMVTFRRVAAPAVLTALIVALATYLGSLNPPDDGWQNCQSEQALLIAQPATSDYSQPCVSDSILPAEYRVIQPQQ